MHGLSNLDYAHGKGGDPGVWSAGVVSNGVPGAVACTHVCPRTGRGRCQAGSGDQGVCACGVHVHT
jgi:hypothetical protein